MVPSHFSVGSIGLLLLATIGTLAAGQRVEATGWYNSPSNLWQCLGMGNGAGYHATLVLGPPQCCDLLGVRERRLPAPPAPACSSCWSGTWQAPLATPAGYAPLPGPANYAPTPQMPEVSARSAMWRPVPAAAAAHRYRPAVRPEPVVEPIDGRSDASWFGPATLPMPSL